MKKRLNIEGIQNELRGGSAFFPGYKRTNSPTPSTDQLTSVSEPEANERNDHAQNDNQHKSNLNGVPLPVPPRVPLIPRVRRIIKQRQPFDIYQDQYNQLKSIADAEKDFVNGRGMSQMVREAIDHYLKEHGSPKK